MISALDTQVGGNHYKEMPIQPMEYSMANGLDACQHTIIKYVTRFRQKGGIQDLEKARHVIEMLIEFERKAQNEALLKAHTHTQASGQSTVSPHANDNVPVRANPVMPLSGCCKVDASAPCHIQCPDYA